MPLLSRRDTFGLLAGTLAYGRLGMARAAASGFPAGSGPVQWCRNTDGVISGGPGHAVSAWQDLSGHGNHLTQSAASHQPTLVANAVNNLPAVSFDGLSQFLENPRLGEPACEIIVARLRTAPVGPATYDLMGGNSPAGVKIGAYYFQAMAAPSAVDKRLAYVRPTVNEAASAPNYAIHAQSQPVVGPWAIYAVRNDGKTVRLYKSGLLCGDPIPVGSVALQPIMRATVGCGFYDQALTDFAPVDIAEKISFSTDLTDAEFNQVIDYLNVQYGLGMSKASGAFVWPVFQGDGVDESGTNRSLVLLQGDGETFRYRPSHYLPPPGYCVRDLSAIEWQGTTLLVHTLAIDISQPRPAGFTTGFMLGQSTDGLATFETKAIVDVGVAVDNAPKGVCWAPEFVRTRDNAPVLLNGLPIVLCNIAPTGATSDNNAPGFQYYLFTPSESSFTKPWTLLGKLQGLPPNIIDGFLFYDPQEQAWYVSVTPCNPPQNTVLYRSANALEGYTEYGTGYDPYGFGVPPHGGHEGTSVLKLADGTQRYFLDGRGTGYSISDNPGGLRATGWTLPRPVKTPFVPQHGTPFPTPDNIAAL